MRWILAVFAVMAWSPEALAKPGTGVSYVVYDAGSSGSFGTGDASDFTTAARYRAGQAPLLYMRRGVAAYVIRDPATLARAAQIMAPQREIGRRQGTLGEQQAALGRKQAKLGAEQGRLGASMAHADPARTRELGRRQALLGSQQAALGSQQSALGMRQAELGRQFTRAMAVAEPKLRALVDDAVRRGIAQRVI